MSKPMKAIVLAAGKGTRLRTEGVDLPKVLRVAAGRPLLVKGIMTAAGAEKER